jgi:hypothetical protein
MQPSISVKQSVGPAQRGRLANILAQRETKRRELYSDPILSLKDCSTALGDCSYGYLRGLLKKGLLPAFRIGNGHWKVRQSDLVSMLRKAEKSNGGTNAL